MNYVRFVIRSLADWSRPEKAEQFLQMLISEDDIFLPEKYDNREPERFSFDAADITRAVEIWTGPTAWLLLKRRKPFHMTTTVEWVYKEQRRFNEIRGSVDARVFEHEEGVGKFLRFAKRVWIWGEATHGYVCHESDWNAKNRFGRPTRVSSGRLVWTGGVDLRQGLPGIYWANFFGPQYVDFFGSQKLPSVPAYHKEKLPDGGFVILTARSPLDFGTPAVHALEQAVVDHLGRDAFFQKDNPEKQCRTPIFAFKQASTGHPFEVKASDPVTEFIPDPHSFIAEAPALAEAAAESFKARLDYSGDSLKLVDDLILRKSRRLGGVSTQRERTRELIRQLTAYYGEVLQRNFSGRWLVARGSAGSLHPVVGLAIDEFQLMEYPFTRVIRLWEERQRADGLAVRFHLIKTGEWGRLEKRLREIH